RTHPCGVRILRQSIRSQSRADQDLAQDSRSRLTASGGVEGVACDVRAAGRVADQEDPSRITSEYLNALVHPRHRASNVASPFGVRCFGRQAVADINADTAFAGEPRRYIGVDFRRYIPLAADVGTAMYEQHDR